MRVRRWWREPELLLWFGTIVMIVLLSSCVASPEQQARAVEALGEMLRSGAITLAQHDALLAALTGGGWLDGALQIVLPIVGAWLGVPWVARLARGKVTARKGLAEALASITPPAPVSRVSAAADAVAAGAPVLTPDPLRPTSTGGA